MPDAERGLAAPGGSGLAPDAIRAFAFELSELKRVHGHEDAHSLAGFLFRDAWARLMAGEAPESVWIVIAVQAIVGIGLGPLRLTTIADLLPEDAAREAVIGRAFEAGCPPLAAALRRTLSHAAVARVEGVEAPPPAFVVALLRQPRAGATAPGKPRLTLLPQENHGEHCLAVAVLGALLAATGDADPARVFLAGLAHHLHNAQLPDTGFAGEVLLGASLEPLVTRLTETALATLGSPLRTRVADALMLVGDGDTPDGRAFNAADVIDRVVQAHSHERALRFSARHALEELDIVHEGPLQLFGKTVLRQTDLL